MKIDWTVSAVAVIQLVTLLLTVVILWTRIVALWARIESRMTVVEQIVRPIVERLPEIEAKLGALVPIVDRLPQIENKVTAVAPRLAAIEARLEAVWNWFTTRAERRS